jgi:hypothetical protein
VVSIQALYRLTRVCWTGLTVSRGIDRSPQGSPRALASVGRRRGQRSNLLGSARCWGGYHVCGGCEGVAGPRCAKTSSPGRKMVPASSRGSADEGEGEETSRSENDTCLVVARTPGREPSGMPQRHWLPGVGSSAVQALRRLTVTTLSRDPTLMVKEQGPRCRTA